MGSDVMCPYATTFSFHTSEARGLKIDRQNPNMDGSKVSLQILDICLEAEIFKLKVLYSSL